MKNNELSNKDQLINILILALCLNTLWSLLSVFVSSKFSEVGGESINNKIDLNTIKNN